MNPLAQVRHVMAKDILQARWSILLYLAIVVLATARALGWMAPRNGTFDFAMFMVVIAGLVVTATVVQADSPIRSDAFWASRPLYPTAMLGAKALLVAVLVLGVPLVGQAVVLLVSEVPSTALVRLVGESAWTYAVWLLVAMLAGALTRDLRSFTTMLIGAPVVVLLMNTWSMFVNGGTGPTGLMVAKLLTFAFVLVGVGGGCALLVALYRTRTAGMLTWLAAGIAVIALFATVFVSLPKSAIATEQTTVAASSEAELFIEFMEYPNAAPQLTLGVSRARDSDRLVMLDSVDLKLDLADGTTIDIPHRYIAMPLTRPRLLGPDTVEWIGQTQYTMPETRTGVQINRRQAEQLRQGIVSATVRGRTWSVEPSVLFTLPFSTGQLMRRDGRTVRIEGAARTFDDSLGAVSSTTIERSRTMRTVDEYRRAWGAPQYVLLNRARHQAVLPNTNMSGSSSESLVLPGASRSERRTKLQWYARNAPVDDAWLGDAQLVVLEWKHAGDGWMNVKATVRPPIGSLRIRSQ